MFLFDERIETLTKRLAGLGVGIGPYCASGLITIQQIDPAELSPGELSLSVVKKRSGPHERTIRQLVFDGGIKIGPPLDNFQGILTGTPLLRNDGGNAARQSGE